jgi:hypothetical protein
VPFLGSTGKYAPSSAPPTPSSRSTPGCAAPSAPAGITTEQAALKCLYLAVIRLDPTGKGRQRWMGRWKAALNAFDITFDGRLSAGRK